MTKKNIFVVCSTVRDRRELNRHSFQNNYNIHFQEYDESILDKILSGCLDYHSLSYTPATQIEQLLNFCKLNSIHGVVSTDDYPGSIYAAIIAHHLGLPGADPQ